MKIKHTLTALLLPLTFMACNKDKDEPQTPGNKPYDLLRKIEYSSGVVANMDYNTDSTLKQIRYTGVGAGLVFYKYTNKQLMETGVETSLYSNTYTYLDGRVNKMLNKWKQGASPTSYYLEYAYNNDGTVATQKYYHTNEAGTSLKAQSAYLYNADKTVKQVTTTQANGHVTTYKIDAYSAEHNVSPMIFISHDLNEFYSFYNLPVMSRMNRLPAKVTRYVKTAGGTDEIDRIDEQQYQINNQKLVKMFSKISYPDAPELNMLDTLVYTY